VKQRFLKSLGQCKDLTHVRFLKMTWLRRGTFKKLPRQHGFLLPITVMKETENRVLKQTGQV